MSRPETKKADGVGHRQPSGFAKDGQAASTTKHSAADIMALSLLLHTAITGARRVASRLALATDAPPFGLVEAADHLDEAGDRVAAIIATGGDHAP